MPWLRSFTRPNPGSRVHRQTTPNPGYLYRRGPYSKGHFVFGKVNISGERLDIAVDGIRHQNSLFPVELQVYSMDGIQGLHIPGAITRKVAKESAGQAVQGFGLTSFDTSLEAQAASAGIEATRSLLSKKAKRIKVTVKAGDRVLLKDKKQKND